MTSLHILHIVAFASPTGEYGGPTRVADNLAQGLSKLGQNVTLISTSDDLSDANKVTVFPVRLFKSFSLVKSNRFASLASPSLLMWLLKNRHNYDLVHIHLARDLITLPAALLLRLYKINYVVQPHGMILPKQNMFMQIFDRLFTLPALKGSAAVFYLSESEETSLLGFGLEKNSLHKLKNGLVEALPVETNKITKASDVLFLARLASRKRPQLLLAAAISVIAEFPSCCFSFVGPDEGELAGLKEYAARQNLSDNVFFEGPLEPQNVVSRMHKSRIYVLPAVDEPFGMTIIEALSAGVPVIVTESAALAPYILAKNAGLVVPDNNPEALSLAIRQLLNDPKLLKVISLNGRNAVLKDFSIHEVTKQLLKYYRKVLNK